MPKIMIPEQKKNCNPEYFSRVYKKKKSKWEIIYSLDVTSNLYMIYGDHALLIWDKLKRINVKRFFFVFRNG